jgi:hypothetical protein
MNLAPVGEMSHRALGDLYRLNRAIRRSAAHFVSLIHNIDG